MKVLDFGSFSQFLKFPDTFITPFHYYDDTDPGRRDNSIVYSRNLSDEFVLHRAKLPGTFLKNIHKIESSIIFHPLPPTNQKSSSKNNQQEAEESAPFGEVRFDNRTCRIISDVTGKDDDMVSALELACMLEKFRPELEQRPKSPNRSTYRERLDMKIRLYVESISDISEVNMDFTTTIRIFHEWTNNYLSLPTASRLAKTKRPDEKEHSILLPEEVQKSAKNC